MLLMVPLMVLASFFGNPQPGAKGGIKFVEPKWSKVLAEAKKQNKLIFVDAYATWCGPCKQMEKNVFPDTAVGRFFNQNFISVSLDVEAGDGIAFGQKYGVEVLPTFFIITPEGKSLTYAKGYLPAQQLIAFGEYGLKNRK